MPIIEAANYPLYLENVMQYFMIMNLYCERFIRRHLYKNLTACYNAVI